MSITCHGRRRPCATSASRLGVGRMARGPAPNALAFVAALILWGALLYLSRPPQLWPSQPHFSANAERAASTAPSALASPF